MGDFTGFHKKANGPTGTIKIESDESVKMIALVHEVPPKRRNVRHSFESKFQLSRLSANPLDEEVTLHPEGDNFSADCTPAKKRAATKRCTATHDTYKKVQPGQELLDLKKELEEKIAQEKFAIANYQVQLEINRLKQTLNQLRWGKQGTIDSAKTDLENNGFKLDDSIITKAKDINLVQAINCINDIVSKDKCKSLLEAMGLIELKTTPSSGSNSEKLSPTSSHPDKEKDKSKTLSDCQILTTSDVLEKSQLVILQMTLTDARLKR